MEEFLEFTGPKREKGGGTMLAINTRAACCWHTTCKVTSMPNAYADVAKVHQKKGAAASSSSARGRGGSGRDDDDDDRRDPRSSRGNNYDDDDHNETKDDSSSNHNPRGSTASLSLASARGSSGPKKVMRRIAGGGTGKEVREQFEMPDRARR